MENIILPTESIEEMMLCSQDFISSIPFEMNKNSYSITDICSLSICDVAAYYHSLQEGYISTNHCKLFSIAALPLFTMVYESIMESKHKEQLTDKDIDCIEAANFFYCTLNINKRNRNNIPEYVYDFMHRMMTDEEYCKRKINTMFSHALNYVNSIEERQIENRISSQIEKLFFYAKVSKPKTK